MLEFPPWWLLLLWLAWILQAWASAGQLRRFVRLYRKPSRFAARRYQPKATVIVPFKGLDTKLAEGVRGLCTQDYPDYELLLVVQSADDPAYELLQRELANYPHRRARVLIAGDAHAHEGQKVHNQLFALEQVYERSADDEVWVFADSDAIPGPHWLGSIAAPLKQRKITGVTTGYRWLIPELPTTIWSHMASLMNSSVACLAGRDRLNTAWGGSMAIRVEIARRGNLRGRLEGALCDDYQFSRLARDLGLRVYFIPQCLVATPIHFDWPGLVNFAHRQYLLTRVYAPKIYLAALAITSLYVAGFFSALIYLLWCLARGGNDGRWVWPAGVMLVVLLGEQMRATLRREVVTRAFGTPMLQRLRTTLRLDRWASPLWMTLHWLLIVRAGIGRTMRWRGILYRLDAPQKCQRLDENKAEKQQNRKTEKQSQPAP